MFKKCLLSFLLFSQCMIFPYNESNCLTDILCSDAWYEEDLGARKGEANPVHLAVTLSECDPEDIDTINMVIDFWVKRGGDLNETFNYIDFFEYMYESVDSELLPKCYKKHEKITLVMLFASVGVFVDALIKAGARSDLDTLGFWIEQYQDFEAMFPKSSTPECMYEFQYEALKSLFNHLNKMDQMKFMTKHASFVRYLHN